MTTSDLERAARAGFEAGIKWPDGAVHLPSGSNLRDVHITGKLDLVAWAAAVLEAIKEPGEDVERAGLVSLNNPGVDLRVPPEQLRAALRAMIDRILEG